MPIGILDVVSRVGLTPTTSFLLGIMFLGYRRTRTRKMLSVTAGPAVFFVHALITSFLTLRRKKSWFLDSIL